VQVPALPDDAHLRYRPLAGIEAWAGDAVAAVDEGAWTAALHRLQEVERAAPDWRDMVGRGGRLAAAHQSAALDGLFGGDRSTALALLRGTAATADVGVDARAHVLANDEALDLAASVEAVSEEVVRHVHEVACRPQLTHPAKVGNRLQDHVLAHGEYKHHPDHVPAPGGEWRPHAPVAQVGTEMGHLAEILGGDAFALLHPVVQAAYVLHALSHIAPFADGNGRTARAVAGGALLRLAGLPLVLFADDAEAYEDALSAAASGHGGVLVGLVLRRSVAFADMVVDMHAAPTAEQDLALDRWRAEVGAAQSLGLLLADAVPRALARHRSRADLGWLSPLSGAEVLAPAGLLVIRVPLVDGRDVEEVLAIEAHPLDLPGHVVLSAREAQLRLHGRVGEPGPALLERLEPWLDRVVSTLALRTSAELD